MKSLGPARIYFSALVTWALFSFFSNSLLALQHVFVFLAFFGALSATKSIRLKKSELFLLFFVIVAIFSVLFNWIELLGALSKALKTKYLLAGVLASILARQCKEILSAKRNKVILFFLFSFLITVVYGLCRFIVEYLQYGVVYRPTGFFGMIMSYSYTAVWPVLLMLFLSLNYKVKFDFKAIEFINKENCRWVLFVVFFLTLCLTQARGALVGLLLAIPFLLLPRKKILITSLVLLFSLSIFSYLQIKASSHEANPKNRVFQGTRSQSNLERLSQFDMAYHAFLEKPILGQGWRSLEERSTAIKEKYSIDQKNFVGHAHNNYLEVLATTGLLGFFFFISWIFFWIKEVFWNNRSEWRYFYLAGIVGFLVSGLFQSTIIDSEYTFTLFAFYGMSPLFTESSPS